MIAVLVLHGVVAAIAFIFGRRLGRFVFLMTAVAPGATFVWALSRAGEILSGDPVRVTGSWVPSLGLEVSFLVDPFSLMFVLLVSGIGVLVMVYASWYFSDATPGLSWFATILVLFAGSMLGLVTADNLLLMFMFWELTSITSYLLIGFENTNAEARAAALKALLVTGFGGLVMLAGIVIVSVEAGTYSMSEMLASPPSSTITGVALMLLLVGAFTKSAQVPFHFWLPGAMAAPTPVSAYLHSATMVNAGIYLIARLSPSFAPLFGYWQPLVVGVGLVTMLFGGYRALREHDAKLVLAYGTVSQLGLMTAVLGTGIPKLAFAGAALIVAHALYKAALFLVVGAVDHQVHNRDIRYLSGLARRMPVLFWVALVATASSMGVPPLFGFIAKEAALEGFRLASMDGASIAFLTVVIGAVLTTAYGARFMWGVFGTKPPSVEVVGESAPRPSPMLVMPGVVLSFLTVAFGVAPQLIAPLIEAAGASLSAPDTPYHLVLWAGFVPSLAWSALAISLGLVLFWQREAVERFQDAVGEVRGSEWVYERSLTALTVGARWVTGHVQVGSLLVYLGVILSTVVLLAGTAVVRAWPVEWTAVFFGSPLELAVAAVVVVAAVATAMQQQRIAAVVLLGAVGYGLAVLFVMYGAPDLALTQFLFETLTIVLLAFVVRRLPNRFSQIRRLWGQTSRLIISVGVGVFVGAFALVAINARTVQSVGYEMASRALPEAGGRNVVNVILIEFRALDTLGEITVLVVAAIGILALVRPGWGDR